VRDLSMRLPCKSYCVRQPVSVIRPPTIRSKVLTCKTNPVVVGAIGMFRRLTQL
jgi:hypothetical protein